MHHSTSTLIVLILIFLVVFVSIHAYIYYRTRTAMEFGRIASFVIGVFFVAMIFAPFITRFAEKNNLYIVSTFFAYTGYTWMGILNILVPTLLSFDIIYILLNLIFKYTNIHLHILTHCNKYTFLLSLFLSLLFTTIGIFEAQNVEVNHVSLSSRNLKEEISPLRIAQISDIHISQTLGYRFVSSVIKRIQEIDPDILVITGDLTDVDIRKNQKIIDALNKITPRYGKYAVSGNHDFYTGIEITSQFYKSTGVKFLRGEYTQPVEGVIIIGVDDDNGRNFDNFSEITEEEIIKGISEEAYTILLKHKPYVNNMVIKRIDLQISGHTHGGQIFPFGLIVKSVHRYFAGLYRLSERMYIYVSRGTGYWGPPLRILSPPEITLFEIKRED